jgi:hypothetical protein
MTEVVIPWNKNWPDLLLGLSWNVVHIKFLQIDFNNALFCGEVNDGSVSLDLLATKEREEELPDGLIDYQEINIFL